MRLGLVHYQTEPQFQLEFQYKGVWRGLPGRQNSANSAQKYRELPLLRGQRIRGSNHVTGRFRNRTTNPETASKSAVRRVSKDPPQRKYFARGITAEKIGDLFRRYLLYRRQIVANRTVLAAISPMAADDKQPPARPLATQYDSGFDLAFRLSEPPAVTPSCSACRYISSTARRLPSVFSGSHASHVM